MLDILFLCGSSQHCSKGNTITTDSKNIKRPETFIMPYIKPKVVLVFARPTVFQTRIMSIVHKYTPRNAEKLFGYNSHLHHIPAKSVRICLQNNFETRNTENTGM